MAISINYLRHLPMENLSLNTIPLAFFILGFVDFFFFYSTLQWGKRVYNFFSGSKTTTTCNKSQHGLSKDLQVLDGKKNQNLALSSNTTTQPSLEEKTHGEIICRQEVEMVLKSLGIFSNPREEDAKLQERLSSDDLVGLFEENKPSLDEVKEAFDVFDENKDGFIDAKELQRILLALGLKEGLELNNCEKMIRVFDDNNDGRIDFDEFVKFMESIDC